MLVNDLWKVFESTGSLEAYLYYKRHQEILKPEEEQDYPVAVNENIVK
ncbi:YqzL family protein [Alkaliphilus hydrothermalis]|uniref:YqzL-like protein n=1 Tax=Alkaliphilus hydrothermalis TaxID=1482730 RepID=A0ABS2NNW7_9FIRM|nr:YqzL family protein [Alkaliphilus hydrothermalis]MBM7614639.1 hypothetical protein [Alkaliphilus hydrothermalis]